MHRIGEHLVIWTLLACGLAGCQTSKEQAKVAEEFRRAAYQGNLERMRQKFEQAPAVLESRSEPGRVFHFPKRTAATPPPFEELEPHRFTALHYAVYMFRTNAVVWLLGEGAEVNAGDLDGVTPLHQAANLCNITLVQILLDHSANINGRTAKQRTPLHWAAVGGDLNTVKLLLERGADPSVRDSAGRTPAMDAARNEHKEIAAYLEKAAAESTRH
ncbi:MAG TPA: ankyrin repeat domain-containing protein [Candidatus Binatia bacterium]|jgi:ankyrin repeat protein|nr:ankyrin repeat domain-containing protein [Candidatus Binatia bacterium]